MKTTYEVDIIAIIAIAIPVLQMRKLRYGAIKLIAKSYTANKWYSHTLKSKKYDCRYSTPNHFLILLCREVGLFFREKNSYEEFKERARRLIFISKNYAAYKEVGYFFHGYWGQVGADKEVGKCVWCLGVWDREGGRICLSKIVKVEDFSQIR